MSELIRKEEQAIINIVRVNRAEKRIEKIKKLYIGRLRITYEWRSRHNLWGRFGGGWNWELGFQASKATLIFNLLVASLRFDILTRPKGGKGE